MVFTDGYFSDSLECMHNVSWDLILEPPLVPVCEKTSYHCNRECLEKLQSSCVLGVLDVPGDTHEQRTSFLVSLLLQFLSTAVSEENGRLSASPLGVWIGVHVNHLTDRQIQETISLSPNTSPFPFEDLIEFSAEGSLERLAGCRAKLKLALAEEAGQQLHPEYLCNQLIIRSLLCIAPSAVKQSQTEGGKHNFLRNPVLLAATLARLMNHVVGDWSVDKVVEGSKDVLRVREGLNIVALIVGVMCVVLSEHRTTMPANEPSSVVELEWGLAHSLMVVRYLVAAGAREAFAANAGSSSGIVLLVRHESLSFWDASMLDLV